MESFEKTRHGALLFGEDAGNIALNILNENSNSFKCSIFRVGSADPS